MAGPGGDIPVYGTDIVPIDILPCARKLHPAPAVGSPDAEVGYERGYAGENVDLEEVEVRPVEPPGVVEGQGLDGPVGADGGVDIGDGAGLEVDEDEAVRTRPPSVSGLESNRIVTGRKSAALKISHERSVPTWLRKSTRLRP